MTLRPKLADLAIIGLYTGRIIIGVGLLMVIPLLVAVACREWNPAIELVIGMSACLTVGLAAQTFCRSSRDPTWAHGMVVASFSWIVASTLGALPHWLSGHYGSYLDAVFDLMSGYTTTGLILIQDLDHVSNALNMWRHLLTYAGGQGIIVVALTFLFRGTAGTYKVYVGEGKEERLLPNVVGTARAIWLVSLVYLGVAVPVLWTISLANGQAPGRAFLHALWSVMTSWSTGGFGPQSYNAIYYHSLAFEIANAAIFVSGSMNFALHWAIWTGRRAEIRRNIEVLSFAVTVTIALLVTTSGLMKLHVYPNLIASFRKIFFQVLSAHTTTGLMTIYSRTLVRQWGPLAILGLTLAMAIGASACSTAGGFKGIRVGLIAKGLLHSMRRLLSPESARVTTRWHHIRTRVLDDSTVSSAMLIVLCYIATYAVGTVVGVACGYEPLDALFDAVSAGSNSGLSCGVTSPAMPVALKITYILEMWAGRLEFVSVFALGGYLILLVKGK